MRVFLMYFVVHVDTGNEWRGGQKQVQLLAASLVTRGVSTAVACPKDSPLSQSLKPLNVPLIDIPSGNSIRTPWILSRISTRLFAAHTAHAHNCCLPFSQRLIVHRRVDFAPKNHWKYRKPKAYIAVSEAVRAIVANATRAPIYVVPDGVDEVPPQPPATDAPDVLAVGALVNHKGHRYLSQAAAFLSGIDIAVAGEGPLRYPHLRYLGFRNDIPSLMAGAKVFVHPSVEEGMGQVLIEAMLSKIPIVATTAGGIPETLAEHATLVPPREPKALVKAIQSVLSGAHPSVEKAYRYAKTCLSVERMVERTLSVYRETL
ncbi:MAG: glycosyltransferase family 4 protein [Myxococcota bacterium]|nr:glycosyltransferase family 4 protein [Myxococcota bacterium]